jgi:hypothetical protein
MAKLLDHPTDLEQELQVLLQQARAACKLNGDVSNECAAAWDAVEEIQAELAHRKVAQKNSLESYCDRNPDADECRIYDV